VETCQGTDVFLDIYTQLAAAWLQDGLRERQAQVE